MPPANRSDPPARPGVAVAAVAAAAFVALASPEVTAAPAPPVPAASAPAAGDISEAEATEVGRAIAAGIANGDGTRMDGVVDLGAILDKATAGVKVDLSVDHGFRVGVIENKLGDQLVSQVRAGGAYVFLGTRGTAADRRLQFRLTMGGGLNYHEIDLARVRGKIRATDVYVVGTGEKMTQTVRRQFLATAAAADSEVVGQLAASEADVVKRGRDVLRFTRLTLAGRHKEALAVYDELPQSLRDEKPFMVLRLTNADGSGDEALYGRTLAEYERRFPDDPSAVLMSIEGLFASRQFDKMLVAVDKLDKRVGGDPYLDLYRAQAAIGKGDPKTARVYLNKLMKAEPAIPGSYDALIDLAVADKDHAETARLLALAERNTTTRYDNLADTPEMADFLKSPEHAAWAAARKTAGAGK